MNAKMVVGGVVALGLVLALQVLRRTDRPGDAVESVAVLAPAADVVARDGRAADEPAESPPGNLKSVAYLPRATPEGNE
jgi:hypothetical protein